MSQPYRWCLVALMTVIAFGGVTALSGAVLLPPLLASGADRWTVAASLGVAVATLATAWGAWWATREAACPAADGNGKRTAGKTVSADHRGIVIQGDNRGVVSTGDGSVNAGG
jgi:hypothetical protein